MLSPRHLNSPKCVTSYFDKDLDQASKFEILFTSYTFFLFCSRASAECSGKEIVISTSFFKEMQKFIRL